MTSESTPEGLKNADGDGVRANAKKFRVLEPSLSFSFPPEWKTLCCKLLELYRSQRQEQLGYKRLGWTTIRDEVMLSADTFLADGSRERDDRLTRQDIEAWQ